MLENRGAIGRRAVLGGTVAGTAILTMPHVAGAQAKVIRVGMPTTLSGRIAILGTSSRTAIRYAFSRINEAGGIGGRTLEVIDRDTKGRPDEAAKITRDLINNDGCEILIDAESSAGSFAVHEVVRDIPILCLHTNSETSSLTADPKMLVKHAFRCARQGVHDAVAGGVYASAISKKQGLKRWMTCSPDYAFGRDNTAEFLIFAKQFDPGIEVVDQIWPRLFAPDYTENITKILQVKPQAMYSALWGGDLVSFVEQANLYRLFGNLTFFSSSLGDPPVASAVKQLPAGVHTAYRYNRNYPAKPENVAFADGFAALAKHEPTNWAWQNYLACEFIGEALRRTNGRTDPTALSNEVAGMELKSPFAVDDHITMRASDHTIIGYPVPWGITIPTPPYVKDFVPVPWAQILAMEQDWKRQKGFA
jgi:branched-chain amino acid transport system substrate-binding protein